MSGINIQLIPAQDYMRFLMEKCRLFCAEQEKADKAYNKLGTVWQDKVYTRTGTEMKATAGSITKIYELMSETIKDIQKRIITLHEYNDMPPPAPVRVQPFVIRLQEGIVPMNGHIKTDPIALQDFINALNNYINQVEQTIKAIRQKHDAMRSYWNDKQYERFTEIITQFSKKIEIQLQTLRQLNMLVKRKRELLLKASS